MIRLRYLTARNRLFKRRRGRRAADALQQEGVAPVTDHERVAAMAIQLAEIRALPEVLEPGR